MYNLSALYHPITANPAGAASICRAGCFSRISAATGDQEHSPGCRSRRRLSYLIAAWTSYGNGMSGQGSPAGFLRD